MARCRGADPSPRRLQHFPSELDVGTPSCRLEAGFRKASGLTFAVG